MYIKGQVKFLSMMFLCLPLLLQCAQTVGPTEVNIEPFHYPLNINDHWVYSDYLSYFNCDPDSANDFFPDLGSIKIEYQVDDTEVIQDSIVTFILLEKKNIVIPLINTSITELDRFYRNTSDGMYDYGYRIRRRSIISEKSIKTPVRYLHHFFSPWSSDVNGLKNFLSTDTTVVYRESPLKYLDYPLEIGSEWLYMSSPLRIGKKVVGAEKITVEAGEFSCYKIQYFYDYDNDEHWDEGIESYEYISEKGLVLRYHFQENIGISSGVNPPSEPQFYCDLEFRQELLSYSIE